MKFMEIIIFAGELKSSKRHEIDIGFLMAFNSLATTDFS